MQRRWIHGALTLTLLALLVTLLPGQAQRASAVSPFQFPYNQSTSVSYNIADVTQAWTTWRNAHITSNNAGGGGRLRVMGGTDNNSTVSEGMGYGILFASLFDEQATLDGLWRFTRDYLDGRGLMHWHIGNPGQILGSGAATDGDEDMALGLLNACIKVQQGVWSASGIDYCGDATNLINAIYTYEVDHPGSTPPAGLSNNQGNELIPGDYWNLANEYPEGIVNLSYFAPGYFTVFGKFTNNQGAWEAVNTRNYQITNLVQGKAGNCSKLVPNWNQYDGDPQQVSWQPEEYQWWSYDAARFAWRVAVDRAWYNTANARETSNELGSFFSSVGMSNIQARYRLNGTSVDSYHGTFFVANAAAAVWAAPSPSPVSCGAATGSLKSSPQQAYNEVLNTRDNPDSYYGNAWRLMSLLLLTGNFPNLYEMAHNTTPTATPLPPTATPRPTSTPVQPTATPRPTSTPVQPTATPVGPTSTPLPPTATPRPTSTPTPGPVGGCSVAYRIPNQWGNGFLGDVTITNGASASINGWTLRWTFGGNQQITNLWNGRVSQTGQSVTVTNESWNGSIPANGSVNFGFQGTYSGSNAAPASFTLNGVACAVR